MTKEEAWIKLADYYKAHPVTDIDGMENEMFPGSLIKLWQRVHPLTGLVVHASAFMIARDCKPEEMTPDLLRAISEDLQRKSGGSPQ